MSELIRERRSRVCGRGERGGERCGERSVSLVPCITDGESMRPKPLIHATEQTTWRSANSNALQGRCTRRGRASRPRGCGRGRAGRCSRPRRCRRPCRCRRGRRARRRAASAPAPSAITRDALGDQPDRRGGRRRAGRRRRRRSARARAPRRRGSASGCRRRRRTSGRSRPRPARPPASEALATAPVSGSAA